MALRSKRQARLAVEELEARTLLTASAFARIEGSISVPLEKDAYPVAASLADFVLPAGRAVLGLEMHAVGSLDPGKVKLTPTLKATELASRLDLAADDNTSFGLAQLKAGSFTLKARAEGASTGAYVVEVFLAGDVNGDFQVTQADLDQITGLRTVRRGQTGYLAEADVDRSGAITNTDLKLARKNLGVSTSLRPPNRAPVLSTAGPLTVRPGDSLTVAFQAADPDGDAVTFDFRPSGPLPTGRFNGMDTLVFTPAPDQVGSYQFTVAASDGQLESTRVVTLNVAADPVTTTRLSGTIQDVDGRPLAGMIVEVGAVQGTTLTDGSFLLDFGHSPVPTDTIKVRGELFSPANTYPFIAEKIELVLEHPVYDDFNNRILRPIYLPRLEPGQPINPNQDTTVTAANISNASLLVPAGSLMNQQGQPYTGDVSITEVPVDLTPAALPDNLAPDLVVTIQPGEMVFTTPAALTLPNGGGWAPGTVMDLWSINPATGEFDDVGDGMVSGDGSTIVTTSGGVRNSSWHFFSTKPPRPTNPDDNPNNPQPVGTTTPDNPYGWGPTVQGPSTSNRPIVTPPWDVCPPANIPAGDRPVVPTSSGVELHSGAVLETHTLVSYESLGIARGIQLTYDSLRADPRPIVHVGYADVDPAIYSVPSALRLVAKLAVHRGSFTYQVPGHPGGELNLTGGENFWTLPPARGPVDAALQVDLRTQPSGRYDYTLVSGLLGFAGARGYIGSSVAQAGSLLHVNTIASPFGSGWGVTGLQEIVENSDGSLLLIDGSGTEDFFEAPAAPGEAYVGSPGDFSTIVRLGDGRFRRTMKDQTVYTFDGRNNLETVVDRHGNTTRFSYDDSGRITKITDPVGLETTFAYTDGRVSAITDPANRTTQLSYDAAGNLVQITDPDGAMSRWEYDAGHHMTVSIDPRGNRGEEIYNFAGRAVQARRPDGSLIDVAPAQTRGLYPPAQTANPDTAPMASAALQALSTYTDGNGNLTSVVLDGAGQAVSASDVDGPLPAGQRDDRNLFTMHTDARGNETTFRYDTQGNVTDATAPLSNRGFLEGGAQVVTDFSTTNDYATSLVPLPDGSVIVVGHTQTAFGDFALAKYTPAGVLDTSFGTGGRVTLNLKPDFTDVNDEARAAVLQPDGKLVVVGGTDAGNARHMALVRLDTTTGALDPTFDRDGIVVVPSFGGLSNSAAEAFSVLLQGTKIIVAGNSTATGRTEFALARFNADGTVDTSFGPNGTGLLTTYMGGNSFSLALAMTTQSTGKIVVAGYNASNDGGLGNGDITLARYSPNGILDTSFGTNGIVRTDLGGNANETVYGIVARADDRLVLAGFTELNGSANRDVAVIRYTADGALDTTFGPADIGFVTTDFTGFRDAAQALAIQSDGAIVVGGYAFSNADDYHFAAARYDADGTLDTTFDADGKLTISFGGTNEAAYALALPGDGFFILAGGSNVGFGQDFAVTGIGTLSIGRAWTYEPTFNQLTSMTDEIGRQTLYEIDPANGNVLSMTRVVGALGGADDVVTQMTYTPQGLLATVTDPNGHVTRYDYNALGRLITVTEAVGTADEGIRRYEYDAVGNLTALIDENGNRTAYQYDAMNRQTRMTRPDPDGAGPLTAPITQMAYDLAGNLVAMVDEGNHTTAFAYDARNRLATRTDALGGVSRYGYDLAGNLISRIDELGRETAYHFDDCNRLVAIIDPEGKITRFSYDADDNLISITDPNDNRTDFVYDARSRLIRTTDPLGKETTYEFNSAADLISRSDRNGRRTDYTYDDLARLVTETWVGGGNVIQYGYDQASNLVAVADSFSSLAITYDARDRVKTVDNDGTPDVPRVVLTYGYDPVGNFTSVADTIEGVAHGLNTHTYDALNRLVQVTQSGNDVAAKRVDLAYNALGQFAAITRYADLAGQQLVVNSLYTYDELNRLTNLTHANATATVSFFDLAYDAASQITRTTDVDGPTDYAYDPRGQLTGAAHADVANPDETYAYDDNGNRTASHAHGTGYQTGQGNRLLSDGTFNYAYDNEGNVIRRTEIATNKVREFQWDHRNRLTAVIDKDSAGAIVQRVDYTYDALDRRISKAVQDGADTVLTHFVLERNTVLLDFVDSDGAAGPSTAALDRYYLHGPVIDQVFAQDAGSGNVQWHLTDHLGSVRDLVDNSGTVVNHITYDSFGNVQTQTNAAAGSRYLFTGRELDAELNVYYYRARYYDAAIGRFLSEDPVGFVGGDANLYRYVGNNPVSQIDPLGLWTRLCQSGSQPQTSPPAPGTIQSTKIEGEVSVRPPGGRWRELHDGESPRAEDEIATGPDSSVTLQFDDGSTLTVRELTQMKLGALFEAKDRIKIQLYLKLGEVRSQIKPKQAVFNDFSIKTPTATASSRN